MRFELDDDSQELARSVRRLLSDVIPPRTDGGATELPAHWTKMVHELGLTTVGVPEEYGGAGDDLVALTAVQEELGKALDSSPYLPTVICSLILSAVAASPDAAQWLTDLADGASSASPVLGSATAATLTTNPPLRIDADRAVYGRARHVLHGEFVDDFLLLVQGTRGWHLVRVAADAHGVSRTPEHALDPTRPMSAVTFEGAPSRPLHDLGTDLTSVETALHRARIALAAEQVGGAARVLETMTQYAVQREQFGRPIGSFQAIKHLAADTMLEVEAARTTVRYAAWAASQPGEDLAELSRVCGAVASDAFLSAAKTSIQVHGAIAFTWEHDAHLYLKRAMGSAVLMGSADTHREALVSGMFADLSPTLSH